MTRAVVVLDTNQLGEGNFLQGLRLKSLLEVCALLDARLYIPETVLLEHLHLRHLSILEELKCDTSLTFEEAELNDLATVIRNEYENEFRSRLPVADPASPEAMREAMHREIWRVLPAQRGRGARDVLVWLDVLCAAKSADAAFFVSNDQDAFGVDGSFHQELVDELAVAGISGLSYMNDAYEMLEGVGGVVAIPTGSEPELLRAGEAGFAVIMNSPGLFVTSLSLMRVAGGEADAWRATWDNTVHLTPIGKMVTLPVAATTLVGGKFEFAASKSFVGALDPEGAPAWTWQFQGTCTIFAELDSDGAVVRSEVISYRLDEAATTLESPDGVETTMTALHRLLYFTSDDQLDDLEGM